MAKKLRLRFKKDAQETGLRAIGADPRGYTVIIENIEVGSIDAKRTGFCAYDESCWLVRLMSPKEPTPGEPCPWKWIRLKKTFTTAEEAKEHIRANVNELWKLCYQKEY